MSLRFGSVCSGIEAASVAWEPLGWRAAWVAEIEPFPAAVLAARWPEAPNLGDLRSLPARVRAGEVEAPEVLCGGTPCQAFSVAGLRRSLDDDRGNLTLTYVELADAIDAVRLGRGEPPAILVWENVPGVLSTADNAFGCLLGGLAGESGALEPPGGRWSYAGCVLGPTRAVAWRVLDAQYFGLAQRRKRVFVVASAQDGFDPAAILFESEGVRRDSAPSREARKGVADTASRCFAGNSESDVAATLETTSHDYSRSDGFNVVTHSLRGEGFDASKDGTGRGVPLLAVHAFDARQSDVIQYGDKTGPLDTDGHSVTVLAFQPRIARNGRGNMGEVVNALQAQSGQTGKGDAAPCVATGMAVRRLTPRECERLQGFPDDYTAIPWRGKSASECPDGPRYKALGNSWAVPVVRWIGARIDAALEAAP